MRTWISERTLENRRPQDEGRAVIDSRDGGRGMAVIEEPEFDRNRIPTRTVSDPWILGLSVAAAVLGLVFVFDAGYARSVQQNRGMVPREFWMQLIFTAAAFGAGLLAARIPIESWRRGAKLFWYLTIPALAGLMVTGLGYEMNGATRWYRLGPITIQPAEFAKVTVVLYLAAVLAARKPLVRPIKPPVHWAAKLDHVVIPRIRRWWPAAAVFAGFALIEAEPDLGTGAVVAMVAFALFWAGGVSRRSLAWMVAVAALGIWLLVNFQPYRLERIVNHNTRWDPANVDGVAYQTVQSELAMASGGIFGVGMGAGRAKHVMPAATTDFISATVAEEFGLFGWLATAGILGALSYRLLGRAVRAPTPFGKLALFGFGVWIGGQTVVNLLMANGTLPAIGIPLPFVSSGGSSLVALGIAIGVCQSALRPVTGKEVDPDEADRDRGRHGRPRFSRA